MKTAKHLGIWMDHSIAHIMEITDGKIVTSSVKSGFTKQEKEQGSASVENLGHTNKQLQLSDYYKQLRNIIVNYEEVLLFGPTTAQNELLNLLKADPDFEKIKIEVKHADEMNVNERIAFVRGYFIHD